MGKLKEWATNRPCEICGKPQAGSMRIVPTCSPECASKRDIYEAIADEQNRQLKFDFRVKRNMKSPPGSYCACGDLSCDGWH